MGIVLDILRCSLHDGPGIRTTVFLKGCPLACVWCHNPESQSPGPVLALNALRCVGCRACAAACVAGCHGFSGDAHVVRRSGCTACGACVAACRAEALEMRGAEMTVASVIEVVLKDQAYYRASGGGLTLSGGEPLMQPDFCLAIAAAARAAGVHVALETSGVAAASVIRRALACVDLFLVDWKVTDAARHRDLTGVSNTRVRETLEALDAAGAEVALRCPLVPGINDDAAHLNGIAALSRRYRFRSVELMPYHRMGNEKARRVGMPVRLDQPDATADDIQRWRSQLRRAGTEAQVAV